MRSFFSSPFAGVATGVGLVCVFGWLGCGGIAVIDGEPGSGGGGESSSSSSDGGSSSGGGSIRSIGLENALAYVDCFPGGGDGELFVKFTLSFENTGTETATIEMLTARLQGMAGVTEFEVTPGSVTVSPMSTQEVDFEKTGLGAGTRGCDWCMPTDTTLSIDLLVNGTPRTLNDEIDSVSCSF